MEARFKELAEQAETYADEKSGAFRGEIFMRCFTEKFAELVEAAAVTRERQSIAQGYADMLSALRAIVEVTKERTDFTMAEVNKCAKIAIRQATGELK